MSEKPNAADGAARAHRPMAWALAQPLKAPEKGVLRALAWHAGPENKPAFPKQNTLADEEGISVGAVKDAIARLEALGLITVARAKRGDGKQAVNHYTLRLNITVSADQARSVRRLRAGARPQPPSDSGATLPIGGGAPPPQPPSDYGRSHHVAMPEPPGGSARSHPVAHKERLKDKDKEHQDKEATAPAMAGLTNEELLRRGTAGDYAGLTEEQKFRAQQRYTEFLAKTFGSNRLGIHAEHDDHDQAGRMEPLMEQEEAAAPATTYPPDDDPCWLAAETWPMKEDGYPMEPPPSSGGSLSRIYEAAKALASDARYLTLSPEGKARSDARMAAIRASGGLITAKTLRGGAA
ncbi:MAG: helix-turn-helix domain-containing protein [Roseateles sp.]